MSMVTSRRRRWISKSDDNYVKTCVRTVLLTTTCFLVACIIRIFLYPSSTVTGDLAALSWQRELDGGDAYPGAFFDLWPYDKNTEEYREALQSCYPSYHDGGTKDKTECHVKLFQDQSNDKLIKKVALARPPGRLGNIFVEFVKRVVRLDEHDDLIEVIPITQQQALAINRHQGDYSLIIRPAILPVLLLAADIVLTLQEDDSRFAFSMKDLTDLMKYEIRWQCHMNNNREIAALTLTLDRVMGFPTLSTQEVQKFLGLVQKASLPKQHRINTEDFPLTVTDRVNKGSALVAALADNNKPDITRQNQVKLFRDLVDQEVAASQGGHCLPLPSLSNSDLGRRLKALTT